MIIAETKSITNDTSPSSLPACILWLLSSLAFCSGFISWPVGFSSCPVFLALYPLWANLYVWNQDENFFTQATQLWMQTVPLLLSKLFNFEVGSEEQATIFRQGFQLVLYLSQCCALKDSEIYQDSFLLETYSTSNPHQFIDKEKMCPTYFSAEHCLFGHLNIVFGYKIKTKAF